MARLDDIARLAPARAREAHLQIADIALARYDVTRALSHAEAAAASADPQTLARVGDLQARAGADDLAIATYRAAVARDANPAATLALARLLVRRGDEQEAADALDGLLRASRDDDAITEAGRLASSSADLRGRLPDLESRAGEAQAADRTRRPAASCSSALLKRLLPPMYRDPAADDARLALGRPRSAAAAGAPHRSRPDARPHGHRAGRHARQRRRRAGAGAAREHATRSRPAAARASMRALGAVAGGGRDAQLAALVALARLGDPRGRPAFARFAAPTQRPAVARRRDLGPRAPADASAAPELIKALDDRQLEVVAAACLGLGRHPGRDHVAAAARAGDGRAAAERSPARGHPRPRARRRPRSAAARVSVSQPLIDAADSGEPELAQAAALALAWSRDPRALLAAAVARAAAPPLCADATPRVPLEALAAWQASAGSARRGAQAVGRAARRRHAAGRLPAPRRRRPRAALARRTRASCRTCWRTRWHAAATRAARR